MGATDAHEGDNMTDYDPRDSEDAYLRGMRQGYRQGYSDGYQAASEKEETWQASSRFWVSASSEE
jgi:flagellar biosynthesis/type III secretory pathway protein FliH